MGLITKIKSYALRIDKRTVYIILFSLIFIFASGAVYLLISRSNSTSINQNNDVSTESEIEKAGEYLEAAALAYSNDEFSEAINNYESAIPFLSGEELAVASFELGKLYALEGDFQKSIDNYSTALTTYEELGDDHNASYARQKLDVSKSLQGTEEFSSGLEGP